MGHRTGSTAIQRRSATQSSQPVDRPRGTYDRLPDEWQRLRQLEDRLTDLVAAHGYRRVETPIIEHAELFARKLGGERLAQTYQFSFRGRELALRPEHTASAMRLYVSALQSQPLPVRLSYGGPVFRYESPQAGRSRQFTEFGCELIGASGLIADAEMILLALSCVREAGVARPSLVLGHIGVVLGFLDQLQLDHRTQDWLIWSMERIRRGDEGATEIPAHLVPDQDGDAADLPLESLDRAAVVELLRQSGVNFEAGSRTPEEVVDGLFQKHRRVHDRAVLEDAVHFVKELTARSGPPASALPALRELIASQGLDSGPIDDLEHVVRIVVDAGFDPAAITVDLGMGRGLRYYTGMLFEIYAEGGAGLQIAGGGRYDDLAAQLGARADVPSAGFSIGLERLLASGAPGEPRPELPAVLILPGDDPSAAFQLAGEFRAAGWVATVEPRSRSASASHRWAARNGYTAVAERAAGGVSIYRCADGRESEYPGVPAPGEVVMG